MNTIFILSSLALFFASAIVEIIGYHKKIKLMEYISKPLMYVFLLTTALFVLIPYLPDSLTVIIFVSISVITGIAGSCLLLVTKKKKRFVVFISILFVLSFLSYLYLVRPSFRLFTLPLAVTLIIDAIYIALLVLYYIFIIKKRNFFKTAGILLFFAPLLALHYGSILTLCGQPKLYSVLLTVGSTIFIASQALIVKGFFKESNRTERLFRMILYVAGQFFLTAGFTIMVSF